MASELNTDIHENVFARPDEIFQQLESEAQYLASEKCQVHVKVKMCFISLQIVAYGEDILQSHSNPGHHFY